MASKAPGKHYRKGITIFELTALFPDNATAEKWFADQRWPEGAHCPYCGSLNVQSGTAHKQCLTVAGRSSAQNDSALRLQRLWRDRTWAIGLGPSPSTS